MEQMSFVNAAAQSGYCGQRWKLYMAWTRECAKKQRKQINQADEMERALLAHQKSCVICKDYNRRMAERARTAVMPEFKQ